MSYEHFETILCADVKVGQDKKSVEYAPAYTGLPRWINPDGSHREDGYVCCYLHAHDVLDIVADTIKNNPMEGITGDHPEERMQTAYIIRVVSGMVKLLAADAAHDGTFSEEKWDECLIDLKHCI